MTRSSTLVVYKTKYGSTWQYAEWIAEALGADLLSADVAGVDHLRRYDAVVVGGSVRMGKITCASFLRRHWGVLQGKRVVLFSVSATHPEDPEIAKYYERSVPEEIRRSIRYFPLWGKFGALDWVDEVLMFFPRSQLRRQLKRDPGNEKLRKIYEGMTVPFDHVERRSADPIIQYCRAA